MKNIILVIAILLTIGCGKKMGMKDMDNEMMKQGMQWNENIKILKLEVEYLKAAIKRLEEGNNSTAKPAKANPKE